MGAVRQARACAGCRARGLSSASRRRRAACLARPARRRCREDRRRHQPAPWPARAAGARAGLARRRARRGAGGARSQHQGADARSQHAARHGQGRGAAGRCHRAPASASPCSATTMSTAPAPRALMQRFLARAWPRCAHLHSRSHVRGLRAQSGGDRDAGQGRRQLIVTVDCGTTSIEPLAVGAAARRRRRGHRSPSGRRAAAATSRRSSIPTGRTTCRGWGTCARRASPSWCWWRPRGSCASRGTTRRKGRRPICWRCSTWWRWRPCAMWCR